MTVVRVMPIEGVTTSSCPSTSCSNSTSATCVQLLPLTQSSLRTLLRAPSASISCRLSSRLPPSAPALLSCTTEEARPE
jgi:hypothetical protein